MGEYIMDDAPPSFTYEPYVRKPHPILGWKWDIPTMLLGMASIVLALRAGLGKGWNSSLSESLLLFGTAPCIILCVLSTVFIKLVSVQTWKYIRPRLLLLVGIFALIVGAFAGGWYAGTVLRNNKIKQAVAAGLVDDCFLLLNKSQNKQPGRRSDLTIRLGEAELTAMPESIRMLEPSRVDIEFMPRNVSIHKDEGTGVVRIFADENEVAPMRGPGHSVRIAPHVYYRNEIKW